MTYMMIGLGAVLIALAGLIGYALGLNRSRLGSKANDGGMTQQQDALMKKYEAILDYDPYGERL